MPYNVGVMATNDNLGTFEQIILTSLVILGENAYSAAYALASAAEFITVPRTGGTGSIGVIVMHVSFEEALKKAQHLGIAETDATHDIDGWDAAVKTAALITVLMDVPIKLEAIHREGIRHLSAEAVSNARKEGSPYKLICRAKKEGSEVTATVRAEQIPQTEPMAQIAGTSSYIYFETDIFPGLAITEENPGLYATAYGMLADFVRAVTK